MSHKWDIGRYKKYGFFYISKPYQWEYEQWGFYPDGDLIYNTCRKIIETNDQSHWAAMALASCADLLIDGQRWPDYLEDDVPKHWKRNLPILKRWYFKNAKWYRSQYSVTRDCFIAYYACAIHLNRPLYLSVKPKFWLYSPKTWAWRRALMGKRNLYKFWRGFPTSKKQFVIDLNNLMIDAYEKAKI